jgi:hypothetical protein
MCVTKSYKQQNLSRMFTNPAAHEHSAFSYLVKYKKLDVVMDKRHAVEFFFT